jgi:RNA polymerase primary sigma factor
MGRSSLLTAESEVVVAERIVAAERKMMEALVSAKSGAAALARLASELEHGRLDIRDVLLNPDQQGLDLDLARADVRVALEAAASPDPEVALRAAHALTETRIDPEILESVVQAVRAAAASDGEDSDVEAIGAIDRARAELKRAKEQLVVGNLRLVVLFARKYLGRGVPLLDLIQEGNVGLMRAADKFDHRRGFRFSTYAAWWIKQALQRALLDRTLRLPVHVADDRRRVGRVRAAFVAQHRREPTADEISKRSGLARERVENILSLPPQPTSLDAPVGEEGDATLGDFVAGSGPMPDESASLHALGGHLEGLLGALTTREQQVLRMRFGIDGLREHTLEEVGRELGLTRERIRQIERHALDKLRARSERVELRSYLG